MRAQPSQGSNRLCVMNRKQFSSNAAGLTRENTSHGYWASSSDFVQWHMRERHDRTTWKQNTANLTCISSGWRCSTCWRGKTVDSHWISLHTPDTWSTCHGKRGPCEAVEGPRSPGRHASAAATAASGIPGANWSRAVNRSSSHGACALLVWTLCKSYTQYSRWRLGARVIVFKSAR